MSGRVSLRKRRLARSFARDCHLATKDDDNRKAMFAKRVEPYGLDPATIAALLLYAIKLWSWWRTKKVKDPGETMLRGEPRE